MAMKGRWAAKLAATTRRLTRSPPATFATSTRIASTAMYASGTAKRLAAESSSVRSSHCVAAVCSGLAAKADTWRARAQIRSERMGFRLYGMADEPICSFSKGSSTSRRCDSRRTSCAILEAEAATPAKHDAKAWSIFRG